MQIKWISHPIKQSKTIFGNGQVSNYEKRNCSEEGDEMLGQSDFVVPVDLPAWATCTLFGIRSRVQDTCVQGLAFYLCFAGSVNVFLSVSRTVACASTPSMLTAFQVFLNAVLLLFLIMPYFFDHVQLLPELRCDAATSSSAIILLVAQAIFIVFGSIYVHRHLGRGRGRRERDRSSIGQEAVV